MIASMGLVRLSAGCQSTSCPSAGCSQVVVVAAFSLWSFLHSFMVCPGFWQCQQSPWNFGGRCGLLFPAWVALAWAGVAAFPCIGPFLHPLARPTSMGTGRLL